MNKLVSIVVPVYNGEKFIINCVQQLLQQDYENIEIILVDDGSKDNSLSIMREIESNNHKVKVFTKENGGTASALNLGFKYSKGYYLTWASCDDDKYSNFISSLVRGIESSGCQFAFSMFEEFIDSSPEQRVKRNFSRMSESGVMNNFLNISYHYCITGICFMFTKKIKNRCGPFDKMPGEDYIMGVKMGLLSDVYFVNEVLGAHRLHPESLTVSKPDCTNEAKQIVKRMLASYAK